MTHRSHVQRLLTAAGLLLGLAPTASLACACGCGVFDVGTSALLPTSNGGTAFIEYDFMDQNRNWSGTSSAPSSANADKEIRTDFMTAGGQYMFNQDWGVMAKVPVWDRAFKTDSGSGSIDSFEHAALGDIRLMGVYTGLSDDMSTGVIFGTKLATGDFTYANFDRDTQIGTGSTDALLGLYHTGDLTSDDAFVWYGQIMWDKPLASQGGYTPGSEIDGAVGVYYDNFIFSDGTQITPILQMIASNRTRDGGINADPPNTGYNRLMLSPGVEAHIGNWKIYGDVEFPIYQDMNGNQLVAHQLFKFILSRSLDE
jgi:hypothetical protein